MRKSIWFILIMAFAATGRSHAQRIDNTSSFRNVTGDGYFRFHYDNDFFNKTDYYYTQGYQLELVAPFLRKNPINKVLLKLKNSRSKFGISFEHFGFTPTSIKSDAILYNDRPFAGVILLKSFAISIDSIRKERLVSTLSTGMIGPAAFAGRMQQTIHRWSGDAVPHGWQYQIGNDVAVNYELSHEKEIFNIDNIASINTTAQVRIGTLSDKLMTGFTLTLGRFDSPFRSREKPHSRNFQLYAYYQPLVSLIGYDASLQGGIFNGKSPYTLSAAEIKRLTFQNNVGVVAHFWKIYMEYNRTFLTREFKSGRKHQWGGVKLGYAF